MPNPDRLRCPECRTRRTDPRSFVLHVMACIRPLCHCMAYTYPHRPMGGECSQNPEAQVRRALQAAGPDADPLDVFLDVVLTVPGKTMKAWPFDRRNPVRESQIEKHLVQRAKERGGEVRKVKWIGRNGAPDRLLMLPDPGPGNATFNNAWWVELKAPGKKPEPHQLREHERMRRMGQRVVVIDSIEAVEALLA